MSSHVSRSLIPSVVRRKPAVHVCGLLGITSIKPGDDTLGIVTDFIALQHFIGTPSPDELSIWLCGTPIHAGKQFLRGCDRIIYNAPAFETVLPLPPKILLSKYLVDVTKASAILSTGDLLVLVLVGQGLQESNSFLVGDGTVYEICIKEQLEQCVHGTKGEVLLISTAPYSENWASEHWTLMPAAGTEQESPSIAISGSAKSRYSRYNFFTCALLAEHGYRTEAPYAVSLAERGLHGTHPSGHISALLKWVHNVREDMGRLWASTGPRNHKPHSLPFVSLITSKAPFQKLLCIPPLPHSNSSSPHIHECTQIHIPTTPTETMTRLSEDDEHDLVDLAADLLKFMPPSTPSEIPTIRRCWIVIHGERSGREPLDDAMKCQLLSELRKRIRYQALALAIARNLGWEEAAEELGGPHGKQMQMSVMYDLQRQAEASGCLLSFLIISDDPTLPWGGAAGWLARVWEASGRPVVSPEDWNKAVERSIM